MVSDGVKGIVGCWVGWVGRLGVDVGLGLVLDFEIGLWVKVDFGPLALCGLLEGACGLLFLALAIG